MVTRRNSAGRADPVVERAADDSDAITEVAEVGRPGDVGADKIPLHHVALGAGA